MKVGCLFGTFDPPHNGHLAIARHMRDQEGLEEVWLVVTPRSPFKLEQVISPDTERLAMVEAAVAGEERLHACDEELKLAPPNFTADTLVHFRRRWPEHEFILIIGSDNLAEFQRWRDPAAILEKHRVLVYPRPGSELHLNQAVFASHPQVRITEAPLLDISSTRIRHLVREGRPVDQFLPAAVSERILSSRLYRV